MNEKIDPIRELLSMLEGGLKDDQGKEFSKNFNALELPSIVSSIVDFLHPLLQQFQSRLITEIRPVGFKNLTGLGFA